MESTSTISFETYYFLELLQQIRSGANNQYDQETIEYLNKLLDFLQQEEDAHQNIEKLAAAQSTSDLAIFFADILDHLKLVSPEDSLQKLNERSLDFLEIFQFFMQTDDWKTAINNEIYKTPVPQKDEGQEISVEEFCNGIIQETISKAAETLPQEMRQAYQEQLNEIINNPQITNRLQQMVSDPRMSEFLKLNREISSAHLNENFDDFRANFENNIQEWIKLISDIFDDHPKTVSQVFQPETPESVFETAESSDEQPFEKMFEETQAPPESKDDTAEIKAAASELDELVEHASELDHKKITPSEPLDEEKDRKVFLKDYVINEVKTFTQEALVIITEGGDDQEDSEKEDKLIECFKGLKDIGQIHAYPSLEQAADQLLQIFNQLQESGKVFAPDDKPVIAAIFNLMPEYITAVANAEKDVYSPKIQEKISLLKSDFFVEEPVSNVSSAETLEASFQDIIQRYSKQIHHFLRNDLDASTSPQLISILNNIIYWCEILMPPTTSETVKNIQFIVESGQFFKLDKTGKQLISDIIQSWESSFANAPAEVWDNYNQQLENLSGNPLEVRIEQAFPAFKDITIRQLQALNQSKDFDHLINFDLSKFFTTACANSALIKNDELKYLFENLEDKLNEFDKFSLVDTAKFENNLKGFLQKLKKVISKLPEPINTKILLEGFDSVLSQEVSADYSQEAEMASSSNAEIDEIFRLEAKKYLAEIQKYSKRLENNVESKDTWHQMGVTVHTLKGSSQMIGRNDISELAEPLDKTIDLIESGTVIPESELVDIFKDFGEIIAARLSNKNPDINEAMTRLDNYIAKFAATEMADDTKKPTEIPAVDDFMHLQEQDSELLEIFQNEVRNNFDIIERNLTNLEKFTFDKEAVQQVEGAAHEICSAAKMLGIDEIASIAGKLEKVMELLVLRKIEDLKSVIPIARRGMYCIRELTDNKSVRSVIYDKVLNCLSQLLEGQQPSEIEDIEEIISIPTTEQPAVESGDQQVELFKEEETVEDIIKDEEVLADDVTVTDEEKVTDEVEAVKLEEVTDEVEEKVEAVTVEEKEEIVLAAPHVMELFLQETQEQMEDISYLLLKLEKEPDNLELQHHLMRCTHTLKGSSGMVKAVHIEALAHGCEDILENNIRAKQSLAQEIFDLLFLVTDEINYIVDAIQNSNQEKVSNYTELMEKIRSAAEKSKMEISPKPEEEKPQEEKFVKAPAPSTAPEPAGQSKKDTYLRLNINKMDRLLNLSAELVISNNQFKNQLEKLKNFMPVLNTNLKMFRDTEDYLHTMVREGKNIQEVLKPLLENKPGAEESLKKQIDNLQRVLKNVKTMQDELTSLSHTLKENSKTYDESLQKLNKLSNEILDEIMQARLVPINMLFQRFHRPIRDLARQLKKQIRLGIHGEDTELDRTLIDELYEPLLHIIRNAIDHGLETVEEREKAGKDPEGLLEIKASRDRNQVIIEVCDDGRGIDLEKVKQSAIEKGLVTEEDTKEMGEQDLFDYLFYPGFSTAKETTMVSGRGVGLDAVKSQIEKAKGDVRTYTEKDKGTTFSIRVPISLSVIQSMLADVSGHVYSIPLLQVEETLHVSGQDLLKEGGNFFIRYRERRIPVVQLSQLLKMHNIQEKIISGAASYPVIMVQDEGKRVALLVDKIIRREEILIKSLGPGLRRLKYISGGSIMADGQVVLVLDIPQVIQDLFKGAGQEPAPIVEKQEVPLKTEEAEPPARHARKRKQIQGRKPVALVVDDSLSIRKYLSSLLIEKGYITDTARNGYEALELLKKQDFDIMVTDLEMPKLSGYELIETLRYDQRFISFPIIVLTGRAGDNFRELTTELGADAYIIKPFKDRELFDQLDRFIECVS